MHIQVCYLFFFFSLLELIVLHNINVHFDNMLTSLDKWRTTYDNN